MGGKRRYHYCKCNWCRKMSIVCMLVSLWTDSKIQFIQESSIRINNFFVMQVLSCSEIYFNIRYCMQILFWLHFVMVMALQTYIKQKTDLISNFLKSELIKAVIQNLNQESFLIRTLTLRTASTILRERYFVQNTTNFGICI